MTGPAVSKHLRVLEKAGLVSRSRIAQSRPAALEAAPLEQVAEWAEEFRQFWDQRFDRLDDYLTTMTDPTNDRGYLETFSYPATFVVKTPVLHLHPRPPRVRGASRACVAGHDRARAHEALAREPGVPAHDLRHGRPRRRRVPLGVRRGRAVDGRLGHVSRRSTSPRLLVSTEQFDAFPGPSTNTLGFAALGEDRTAMTLSVVYPSREIRDGWVASGMTEGLGAGYDRLDEVLADG